MPVPWCDDFSVHLNDIFTRLKIVGKEKSQGTLTDEITNMTAIFKAHNDWEKPRTVLIEGDPGMGKTTYCQKLAYDWATKQDEWDESFPETDVLLLLRCRDIKSSSIKEAIDDQILPYDVTKEAKDVFFQVISENQLKVLLVLDGLDEVDASKLEMIENLLKSKEFAYCHIVLTSRHEAGKKVRRYCDTLWEIVGFTKRDAQSFIVKYFQNIHKEHLAYKLVEQLWPLSWQKDFQHKDQDDSNSYVFDFLDRGVSSDLRQLTKNPLNTALLCILFEDFNGTLPENRTQLYTEIVQFVLKRYENKNRLSSNREDLISVYEKELLYLGRMAFQALRKGELDFEGNESGDAIFSLLIKFGFLTIQAGGSKRKPRLRCGFFHKSFQEFFSGLYLAFEIGEKDIVYLVTDGRYLRDLKEVFLFMTGIAASRGEETVVPFVSRIASPGNVFDGESDASSYLKFALSCILQCTTHQKDLRPPLIDILGKNLHIKTLAATEYLDLIELFYEVVGTNSSLTDLDLRNNSIGDTGATSLSQALTVNSSLTNLNLSGNSIGVTGATSLSQALIVNSSLTNLNLRGNSIGKTGATSLSQALTVNSSLTNLDLCWNSIGVTGATSLSQALIVNSSLTNLNLRGNSIGKTGAKFLSKALTVNSSLTNLDLCWNSIGDTGAKFISQALTVNSSLTNLDLSGNRIAGIGAESISQALTVNSSLTNLDLSGNGIGGTGAASLSQALRVNSSLTNLDLCDNVIGDTGANFLSQALTVNSSLTNLDLRGNSIGDTGVKFLSQTLAVNSSLTNLDLLRNRIGDTGAAYLSRALKVNSSLTNLDLRRNSIGDTGVESISLALTVNSSLKNLDLSCNRNGSYGAASLSWALTLNSSLTHLDLNGNSIGDTGAASLSQALTVNSSLTNLVLNGNSIGDTGAASLSRALTVNSSLTNLVLNGNSIGDTGAASLSRALTVNSSLTNLVLNGNSIGDTGAASLSRALTVNSSLTRLDLSWNSISRSRAYYLFDVRKANKTVKILV